MQIAISFLLCVLNSEVETFRDPFRGLCKSYSQSRCVVYRSGMLSWRPVVCSLLMSPLLSSLLLEGQSCRMLPHSRSWLLARSAPWARLG